MQPHRPAPHRRLLVALAAVAVCVAFATDTRAAQDDDFLQHLQSMHDDFIAMEAAWYRLVEDLPGRDAHGGPQVLRLSMPKALSLSDMEVEVIRWNGRWLPGRLWVDRLSFYPHSAQIQEFKIGDKRGKPTVLIQLQVELERGDGWDRDMGVETAFGDRPRIPGTITIEARGRPTDFRGTFRLAPLPIPDPNDEKQPPARPMPDKRGTVKGSLQAFRSINKPHQAPPTRLWKRDSDYRLYAAARWAEALVDRRYVDIRALALARSGTMTYEQARAECRYRDVARKDIRNPIARKRMKRSQGAPSLDDMDMGLGGLGGDLGGGDPLGGMGAPKKERDPQLVEAGKLMKAMARRTARTVAIVKEYERRKDDPTAVKVDGLPTGDPAFGPWYEVDDLPWNEKQNAHQLALQRDAGNAQAWPAVAHWKLIGPFSRPRWDLTTPLLPDALFDFDADYNIDSEHMPKARYIRGDHKASWQDARGFMTFGFISPPDWSTQNRYYTGTPVGITAKPVGIEHASFYAATRIDSPRDMEVWAAIGVNQQAKLWINDKLCWMGPDEPDPALLQDYALTRLPLRRGVNRLVLRCDVGRSSPFFWMRVCTQGQPRSAEEVRADAQRVSAAHKQIDTLDVSGYRGNFTGRFPQSHPPAAWDYHSGENVRWFTPLPYWSNASPALAEDRLFVAMEPHWLVCLAKEDGRVLWKKPVTVIDTFNEADRKKGWQLYKAWWDARRARDAVPQSDERPDKWLSYSKWWADYEPYWQDKVNPWRGQGKDERAGASPELLALLDRRDELEQAEDPEAVQDELTQVLEQIEQAKARSGDSSARDARRKKSAESKAWRAFIRFVGRRSSVRGMSGYWTDYDAYTFATPVTDGKHVWWKNGMDAVACFDMAGNRKWIKAIEAGGSQSATIPSPILLDGKLIIKTPHDIRDGRKKQKRARLLALDPQTGEQIWETTGLPRFGMGWAANTPAPVMLTNGRDSMRVLVTAGGSVVRADDGKVLVRQMGGYCADASVVPLGDIVVFPRPHLAAFRLIMVDRDTVGCKLLWMHQMGTHGVGYHGTVVTDDGLICHETSFGHFYKRWDCSSENGPGEDRIGLIVKDVVTGEMTDALQMHRKGANYWSLHSQTADHVMMLGGDTKFRGKSNPKPPHTMTVFSRGREPVALARNGIDRTYGGPAFDAERMYLRGYGGVWCVGYTGASGRAYEARIVAQNLLDAISTNRPGREPAEPLTPRSVKTELTEGAHGKAADLDGFISRLEHNRAPHSWLMAGPLPLADADRIADVLNAGQWEAAPGMRVGRGGESFQKLNGDNYPVDGLGREVQPQNLTLIHRQRRVVPLDRVVRPGTVCWLYTQVRTDAPQTMRFEQELPHTRVWIGGVPVQNGDVLRFDEGTYGILAEVRVESLPPDSLPFSPRFYDADDPPAADAAWLKFVQRNRGHLEKAVRLAPDSAAARRAGKVLKQAER